MVKIKLRLGLGLNESSESLTTSFPLSLPLSPDSVLAQY